MGWDQQVAAHSETLSKSNHIVVIDFIGFHRSDKPHVDYHNALLSQFLAGFIDTLQLKDVILMGHTVGVNTATYAAFHHPQNIAHLVLVDGAGYHNPDRDLTKPLLSLPAYVLNMHTT